MTTVVVNDSDDGDFCGDGYSGGQGRREGGGEGWGGKLPRSPNLRGAP